MEFPSVCNHTSDFFVKTKWDDQVEGVRFVSVITSMLSIGNSTPNWTTGSSVTMQLIVPLTKFATYKAVF